MVSRGHAAPGRSRPLTKQIIKGVPGNDCSNLYKTKQGISVSPTRKRGMVLYY